MSDLKGKTAIVTGASKGLGAAVARRFAEGGAQVTIAARSKEQLEQLAQEYPDQMLAVTCDVTQGDRVEAMVDQTVKHFGKLDILVNNAGVGRFGQIHELSEADWDLMMDVNLKGAFLTSKAAIPHLKDTKGHIVNVSSVAGTVTFPGGGGYCASKFGLMALSDVLTQELKKDEVKVNTICPGSIQTEFFRNPKSYALTAEQVTEAIWTMVTAPAGVIYNQVIMRPQVPPDMQK
ncbi:MAG: SDR family NAD(P)-dependent oxidoreductase [Firmicutes bacterium]|uniref:NADP-dependent 3-hydroxy acid dehydrogenase YdfG n=1 Tax=Melghirimyces thermohalophilus TaxID=1236220 RepID=A0A1G6LPD2_9BACL|nr:SDR family NAD(P)-dependent oxidoreductase [Melghirimyces thermohalophilus]MDA8352023.1 SDR family NAD(P)-dependent oxidoreductase [Bacillota bacterium]SDC44974.1 NADP-dependent 3-hydroxy acid dehydrogenase YdfG [Melghirimyces thermohalophilus]